VCLQVGAYPSLSPLVLVLKIYLRSCGLNEVANGGISSFALTNMVLAHIMDELRVRAWL
jgi:non-canonical poly(A) RNA polymerase PAPD5/7